MLLLVYKCVNGLMPTYLSSYFMERNTRYGLRGIRKLVLPKPRTSTCGLNSFTYFTTNHGIYYLTTLELLVILT